jgi:hypothetical protein
VADPLRAGEQGVVELHGVEIEIPVDLLEPLVELRAALWRRSTSVRRSSLPA